MTQSSGTMTSILIVSLVVLFRFLSNVEQRQTSFELQARSAPEVVDRPITLNNGPFARSSGMSNTLGVNNSPMPSVRGGCLEGEWWALGRGCELGEV